MKRLFTLVIALMVSGYVAVSDARSEPQELRRLIVGLYDGREVKGPGFTRVHTIATMPLNHLGFVVKQYDVSKGLPPDEVVAKAHGIFTWFLSPVGTDRSAFLSWANKQVDAGRRFVIFGHPGAERSELSSLDRRQFDLLMRRIGVNWENGWVGLTYDTRVKTLDRRLYEFERKLPLVLPAYPLVTPSDPTVRSLLVVSDKSSGRNSHLALIGPMGAYVAPQYAVFLTERGDETRRAWYLNPFEFFRHAFKTDSLPKPDTTTLSGRRVYYSHIDGDAWHNISRVEAFIGKNAPSAKVAYELIFKGYPDLPVTVGAVTGDLETGWYGNKEAVELARKIYALPNIEAGTHTHSHPFAWGFFHNTPAAAEIPYLKKYPPRPGKSLAESVWDPEAVIRGKADYKAKPTKKLEKYYTRPRAYAVKRFDLKDEIIGSIRFLEDKVLPPGKKVMIVQWSGDTEPWAKAIAMTRAAKVRNINGGDPRMDGDFTSYAWVAPLARHVDDQWQVYSSGSNENIYTKGWSQHYAGYRRIVDTFRNTGSPIRVKPINIYYHFYTAERSDAFNALRHVIEFARKQDIAPVTASQFAAMVDGFLKVRIVRLDKDRWRIENRDGLQTIRFDRATLRAVDFARSKGVIGQRWHQGSLYVSLDGSVKSPIVATKATDGVAETPAADRPYLIDSRWSVRGLAWADKAFRFIAKGFGDGEFRWRVRLPGLYRIVSTTDDGVTETTTAKTLTNTLVFRVKTNDAKRRRFKVERIGEAS